MDEIFDAIGGGNFGEVKRIITYNPGRVYIRTWKKRETPLDVSIKCGELKMAKFLFERGGRPNLDAYCDGKDTPVHCAVYGGHTATLKWVITEKILPPRVLNHKDIWKKKTPLDIAIARGNLEMAEFLWEMGGQPNLENYRDGINTPVHRAAWNGYTKTLKWLFAEKNVLSLDVLKIKDWKEWTPLDNAMSRKKWETITFLRRLMHLDPIFLTMQRAKRDFHQMCVLRKLPNELLDMVVDEVARRFHLKVVW